MSHKHHKILDNCLEWSSQNDEIDCIWKFKLTGSESLIEQLKDLSEKQLLELLHYSLLKLESNGEPDVSIDV